LYVVITKLALPTLNGEYPKEQVRLSILFAADSVIGRLLLALDGRSINIGNKDDYDVEPHGFISNSQRRVGRHQPFFRFVFRGQSGTRSTSVNYLFVVALGIGFATGLRSLTPPALVAWAAHLGWLNLSKSAFAFMGSTITVIIFSLLAVLELIGDVLPQMSKRTAPFPLMARIIMGGLCGACLFASGDQSWLVGSTLGGVGAVIGAFAGYEIRRRLVAELKIKDIFIALLEDLVTIGLAFFLVRI